MALRQGDWPATIGASLPHSEEPFFGRFPRARARPPFFDFCLHLGEAKTMVKLTRKHLYISGVGVKVKGEGKKCTSTGVRMRGRVSCHPRVGKGRRVVHFGRKGVDFGVKVVLFSSSR